MGASRFIAHSSSDELYYVTSGEYGSGLWYATPIGMADVQGSLNYSGESNFYPVTNPRTLRAWADRMHKIKRPECAEVIESALESRKNTHDMGEPFGLDAPHFDADFDQAGEY